MKKIVLLTIVLAMGAFILLHSTPTTQALTKCHGCSYTIDNDHCEGLLIGEQLLKCYNKVLAENNLLRQAEDMFFTEAFFWDPTNTPQLGPMRYKSHEESIMFGSSFATYGPHCIGWIDEFEFADCYNQLVEENQMLRDLEKHHWQQILLH